MLYQLERRFHSVRTDTWAGIAIVLGFMAAAMFLGLVIATGRTVPTLLALGAVAGITLLNALPLVIWSILIGVLLVSGPVVMFVPDLEKAGWLFSLMGFFLAGAALLYATIGRERFSRPAPAFVVLILLFFVYGLLSMTYSGGAVSEGVRAAKRYFQFYGLLFALAVVPFPAGLVRRWWAFFVMLGLVQLPFALYQRFVLAPGRVGMTGVDAVDIVVGTMEGSLTGGGSSGVMALLLITIFAFLLASFREGLLSIRRMLLLSLLVLAPLPLGEVNLVAVLMPLAAIAIYLDLIRRSPFRFLLAALLGLLFVLALGWAFFAINAEPGQSVNSTIEALIAYNLGETGYYGEGLNRTTVYTYWWQQQRMSDPIGILFGHGLGSSFDGIRETNPGHMAQLHPWMYIGLAAASAVLWDLGVLGILLVLWISFSAVRCAARLARLAQPGFDRAFCRALCALALMLVAMLAYNDGPIALPTQEVLFSLCLGLIAWRWRMAESNGTKSPFRAS